MKLERSYEFSDEEVLARLHALTDYWAKKHGVLTTWEGTRASLKGKVLGVRFDGTVDVGSGKITANVSAGLLAERLGGTRYVESKLDDYLDPANSVAALVARIPA